MINDTMVDVLLKLIEEQRKERYKGGGYEPYNKGWHHGYECALRHIKMLIEEFNEVKKDEQ